jgi:D-lactate dehydrogenase
LLPSHSIKILVNKLQRNIPESRIFTDPLYTLAKGTDAGFYRLVPRVVVRVESEIEIIHVLRTCSESGTPLTFKAGGTSLSGQTISDSVLVEIGDGFSGFHSENGDEVTLQCGITGAMANARLAKFGRRIGPDPSSINSAKIGGIVSNNASGGAFGIQHNSYNTLLGMRIVLADGTVLNTLDPNERKAFEGTHAHMLEQLSGLSARVRSHSRMSEKIRHKYELKNTCGYGINALIDFTDPFDIMEHLMVGAEGTLGFISGVTLKTVPEFPLKATSLIFFPSLRAACEFSGHLKNCIVTASELMDRNALRSVQDRPGMPAELQQLGEDSAALLIDTSAYTMEALKKQILQIKQVLENTDTLFPVEFTTDRMQYERLWKVRKGLFTSAAAARPTGTACIIEDLAFRQDVIADALTDLRGLTEKYGYHRTVIWGHILDGNIHFVITPDFSKPDSLSNYDEFMHEVVRLVIRRYDGSLKGEHGTGRNMAPFVREEWGDELYEVMREIKQIFDPRNLLNPGVILNDDPAIHLKNIKSYPLADPIIDPCIECGFCEVSCPSKSLTITPRQRIVIYREMARLAGKNQNKRVLARLKRDFQYHGDSTCATDGLCATACPVEINTGILIKELRFSHHGAIAGILAGAVANHMESMITFIRRCLNLTAGMHRLLGTKIMAGITMFLHRVSFRVIPLWNPFMPKGAPLINFSKPAANHPDKVVYFPSCINRAMGKSADYGKEDDLLNKSFALLNKAGFGVIIPENINKLCCGMAFDSKGFKKQGRQKAAELEEALLQATDNGMIPVYCDMSPCLYRMKETLDKRLKLYEPAEFILTFFPSRLTFRQLPIKVTIHSTCSNTKMGLDLTLKELARMCAAEVLIPEDIGCCGWAGDRGFTYPELNASALKALKSQIARDVTAGFSTSRTCEIGLSLHSGISYKSIIYLVDQATEASPNRGNPGLPG